MTEEETKAWTLLSALHPGTRRAPVRRFSKRTKRSCPGTRSSPLRQEELQKTKDKGKEKSSSADNASDKPNARKTHAFRGRGRGRGRSMSNSNDRSDKSNFSDKGKKYHTGISCYTGHYQKDCWSQRRTQPWPLRRQKTSLQRHDRVSGVGC